MDITVTDAAMRLSTTIPRVRRAIARLGIVTSPTSNGPGRPRQYLDEKDFLRLRDDLGSAPARGPWSREDMRVLAAFLMNPFGFRSRRAVAATAGISPTTASAIVDRLINDGLIVEVRAPVRSNGRVTTGTILAINETDERWGDLLGDVLVTQLPRPRVTPEATIVPRRFWHLFWNAHPSRLPIDEHADFIASRMLLSRDPFAVSWAATHLPPSSIEKTSSLRQVDRSDGNWLRAIARARRTSEER